MEKYGVVDITSKICGNCSKRADALAKTEGCTYCTDKVKEVQKTASCEEYTK